MARRAQAGVTLTAAESQTVFNAALLACPITWIVIGIIAIIAAIYAVVAAINKIPGVTVDITSGLDNFYAGLEEAQKAVKDKAGWVEYVKKMDFIDYGEAASAGYKFGEGIEDKVSGLFTMPTLDEMSFDSLDAFNLGNTLDGIYGNTGDTAANTAAAADTLDYMDEDLVWMRDIAEREAINHYRERRLCRNAQTAYSLFPLCLTVWTDED